MLHVWMLIHACMYVTPLVKIVASKSQNDASYSWLHLRPFALIILVMPLNLSLPGVLAAQVPNFGVGSCTEKVLERFYYVHASTQLEFDISYWGYKVNLLVTSP